MNRITHFEIQADDLERAAKFYTDVFGWEIKKWENSSMDYWMIMTASMDSTEPGINGGLMKRPCPLPDIKIVKEQNAFGTNAFTCTVQVDDYDAYAAKIIAAGGKEAMAKFNIADMAWQGYYVDTERNVFGLHQQIKKE